MQTRFKNLEIFYSMSNPNDAYECFLKVFSGTYDLAFYLKTISVKKTLQNPWLTKGLFV